MRYRLKIHLNIILFALTLSQSLTCQGQVEKKVKECKICNGGIHNNYSPYVLNLKKELPFLITGTALSIGGIVLQNAINLKPLTEAQVDGLDPDDVFFLDKSALNNNSKAAGRASDILRTSITLVPLYFLSNHHNRKDFSRLFVMAVEVFTINYGITTITKNLVQRVRPIAYNTNVPFEEKGGSDIRRSFFSGHASHTAALSFFAAKVMHDYHPNARKGFKIALWSFASIVPAGAAFLRVRAGKHFRTDVITGYLVGAGIGLLVPHLHRLKKKNENEFTLYPVVSPKSTGLGMLYRF